MLLETAITVQRPRDQVFRRVVDEFPTTHPLICSLVRSVEIEGANRIDAGARGRMRVRRSSLTTATADFEVIEYTAALRFTLDAHRGTRHARAEYVFADADGGTEVTISTTFNLPGPGWLQQLHLRALRRHDEADGRRLKALLEGTREPTVLAARSPWRAFVIYAAIGAVAAALWLTFRSLSA
jgi:hypothetical protein